MSFASSFKKCISENVDQPAPTTTLDTPRHSDMYPSTLEIVAIALPMPLYIAAGVGLTTCMRVCAEKACQPLSHPHPRPSLSASLGRECMSLRTLSRSMGYMTECSYYDISLQIHVICPSFSGLTAMPANAPATMLAASEKFGGSDS